MIYANEFDKKALDILKSAPVHIDHYDSRSVVDVKPEDLEGFRECHFFAGIGGWLEALRLAKWPGIPVWTASLPCQPFSDAGRRKGFNDERHLWPVFKKLIEVRRPPVIFGEQTASKTGKEWLSMVRSDLEALGYAVGAADLCSASVGSPNVRQRLYWVAYTESFGWSLDEMRFIIRESDKRLERSLGSERSSKNNYWSECQRVSTTEKTSKPFPNFESDFPVLVNGISYKLGDILPRLLEDIEEEEREELISIFNNNAEKLGFPVCHNPLGWQALNKGFGNAICPPLAAEFIGSFIDLMKE